jgi:CheY-like chemotaxis protein
MRPAVKAEFGEQRPRAAVLDDSSSARTMTSRRLRSRGFEVQQYRSCKQFLSEWKPGTVDVIIADWQLSSDESETGDHVLERVRSLDWEVPFVLVSGKLDEDEKRVGVLATLLEGGSARFVPRGRGDAIRKVCDEAEDLIERRDPSLLKVILALRPGALAGRSIPTTTGRQSVAELLAEAVSRPSASHYAERPVAARDARRKHQRLRGK